MVLTDTSPPPRRSRRRAVVFSCVFVPALAASLSYVYLRPAEYRAVARLQIAPAAAVTQPYEIVSGGFLLVTGAVYSVGARLLNPN